MRRADAMLDLCTFPGDAGGGDLYAAAMRGFPVQEREVPHTLPEGLRLLDYEIIGAIGQGGFGIVYLAWDHAGEQHVAIKEYLPATIASRDSVSPAVRLQTESEEAAYRAGLQGFVDEALTLARFDHPALVKVLRYWEANGTAYMAMPYYDGPTLAQTLAERDEAPDQDELLGWLGPLTEALGILHAADCLHRDVAPDNILITGDSPVLLDFGAARRMLEGATQPAAVLFKPGFTPIEQHGESASLRQGPWTDVYALAAVAHAAITGEAPPPSVERQHEDRLRPLTEVAAGRYGRNFLAAVDAGLALRPEDRPQDMAAFWRRLSEESADVRAIDDFDDFDEVDAVDMLDVAEAPAVAEAPPAIAIAVSANDWAGHAAPAPAFLQPVAPGVSTALVPAVAKAGRIEPTLVLGPAAAPPAHMFEIESAGDAQVEDARAAQRRGAGLGTWTVATAVVLLLGLGAAAYDFHRRPAVEPPVAKAVPPAPAVKAAPAVPQAVVSRPAAVVAAKPVSAPAVASAATTSAAVASQPASPPAAPKAVEPVATEAAQPPAYQPSAALAALLAPLPRETEPPTLSSLPETPVGGVPLAKPGGRSWHGSRSARDERRRGDRNTDDESLSRPIEERVVPLEATATNPSRCTEILERASLGPVTAGEADYLRRGCR